MNDLPFSAYTESPRRQSVARIDFEKPRFLNRSPIDKHSLISPQSLARREPYISKASFVRRAMSLSPKTKFDRKSPERGSLFPLRHRSSLSSPQNPLSGSPMCPTDQVKDSELSHVEAQHEFLRIYGPPHFWYIVYIWILSRVLPIN